MLIRKKKSYPITIVNQMRNKEHFSFQKKRDINAQFLLPDLHVILR